MAISPKEIIRDKRFTNQAGTIKRKVICVPAIETQYSRNRGLNTQQMNAFSRLLSPSWRQRFVWLPIQETRDFKALPAAIKDKAAGNKIAVS